MEVLKVVKLVSVYEAAYAALMENEPVHKVQAVQQLQADWQAGRVTRPVEARPAQAIPTPGRPLRPELVAPAQVKQRKLGTLAGRVALLHAVAHIEFNAINLALDAVYRFRDLPDAYYQDWLQVAAEEAYHFECVQARLQALGSEYGALPAHNGLWEQACLSDHDVMVRMALVPRVLEARGLDVTPGMMQRLREVGDESSVALLELILRDEIGHVRIGSRWFHYACAQRGLEPESTFRQLLAAFMKTPLRGPFYVEGRLQAGFSLTELKALQALEDQWLQQLASGAT